MARRRLPISAVENVVMVVTTLVTLLYLCLLLAVSQENFRYPTTASRLATGRPCEEIYMVAEGESLHTISDKCNDPFIVERNPHVYDPDDVYPGLVLRIVPQGPSA